MPRWGSKSAATVLARLRHLEAIPRRAAEWRVPVRGAAALAASLRDIATTAFLYRRLATLRTDVPLTEQIDDLKWHGARRQALTILCREIEDEDFLERVTMWRGDS